MEAGEMLLDVKDLCASVEDNGILKGINFQVKRGEVHAIMGPNGSGKSTFSKVLVGHPSYEVTGGTVEYRKGEDLLDLEPEDRAQQGVFLAFQYPVEIAGVSNSDFLRLAVNKRRGALGLPEHDPIEFFGVLAEKMQTVGLTPTQPLPQPNPNPNLTPHPNPTPTQVGMSNDFIGRDVNGGFSGGEKKRNEILQMALLGPELSILDETDSGLDIDALKTVAAGVNAAKNSENGIILITHYQVRTTAPPHHHTARTCARAPVRTCGPVPPWPLVALPHSLQPHPSSPRPSTAAARP
jgi:Fe-S cluster assembly ATP-binding protein